jgi:hypothetical protein
MVASGLLRIYRDTWKIAANTMERLCQMLDFCLRKAWLFLVPARDKLRGEPSLLHIGTALRGILSPRKRSTGATILSHVALIPMPLPKTRQAQAALRKINGGAIFFSGEALYAGRDMGTVEAAVVNGKETARAILAAGP